MCIFTSYFGNKHYLLSSGYKNLWSIAGITPEWFYHVGERYSKLAPKYSWWKEWHDNSLSEEWYIEKYYKTVLDKLNQNDVILELGNNAVLLCYEGSGKFCHRRIVANWIENNTGINVKEI